ncbi:MAG: hypothetical protein KGH72_03320 [Candidatus Micrarchaeota archaeon]|nr:hypothetical protein [Candidatus Micrarchaeota archaeon]
MPNNPARGYGDISEPPEKVVYVNSAEDSEYSYDPPDPVTTGGGINAQNTSDPADPPAKKSGGGKWLMLMLVILIIAAALYVFYFHVNIKV